MNEEDFQLWTEIRPTKTATYYQRQKIAELLSKYYGHKYKVPCACPSTIRQLVSQLDKLNESREN